MNTSEDRRRRRRHSPEFKAKVIAACRKPGISLAAVALANRLNANLLRRWVVEQERAEAARPMVPAKRVRSPTTIDHPTFVPVPLERPATVVAQEIGIEIRRGATVVKVGWPLLAAGECAAWLRELLR